MVGKSKAGNAEAVATDWGSLGTVGHGLVHGCANGLLSGPLTSRENWNGAVGYGMAEGCWKHYSCAIGDNV